MNRPMVSIVLALMGLTAVRAEEKVAHWTGAYSREWNDTRNWAEGVVPGRRLERDENNNIVKRDKQGNIDPNGDWLPIGERGWTAIFDSATANDTVNTGGGELVSISNVIIRGANNTVNFGTHTFQYFPIEVGGGIYVEADAVKVPTFTGDVMFTGLDTRLGRNAVHIVNDSPHGILTISSFDRKGVLDYSNVTPVDVWFGGSGTNRLNRGFYNFQTIQNHIGLAQSSGGVLIIGGEVAHVHSLKTGENLPRQRLVILEGATLMTGESNGYFSFHSDLSVSGAGTWSIASSSLGSRVLSVKQGMTVDIACPLSVGDGGFCVGWEGTGYDAGTVRISGPTTTSGNIQIYNAGTIEVPSVGNAATPGALGSGSFIDLRNRGILKYTGPGESTGRTLKLSGSGTQAWIYNNGTGDLVFSAVDAVAGNPGLFVMGGPAAVGFECGTDFPIRLYEGAALLYANTAAAAVASIEMFGNCQIKVADGVALSVAQLIPMTDKTLDLALTGSASVKIAGYETPGVILEGITVNGEPAKVNDDGFIVAATADDVTIDARGGVIPNEPQKVVGISTAAGEEGDTLTVAEDETAVLGLNQHQGVEPAVVSLDAGQTLSAGFITIDELAQPLVVAGPGSLCGAFDFTGDSLVRTNGDAAVSVSSDGGARLKLEGALTESAPLDAAVVRGNVTMSGTGRTPVSSLSITGGAELTWKDGALYQPGVDLLTPTRDPGTFADAAIHVGWQSTGVLNFDGGSYTGALLVGSSDGSGTVGGSVYLNGGEIAAAGEYQYFRGSDYLEISGGRYVIAGDTDFGRSGQFGLVITGGTFKVASGDYRKGRLYFGSYDSDTSLYVGKGGLFDASEMYNTGYDVFAPDGSASGAYRVQWTAENGGIIDFNAQNVSTHSIKTSTVHMESVFNLNAGGSLRVGCFYRTKDYVYPTADDPNGLSTNPLATNRVTLVQFDGGTLVSGAAQCPFRDKHPAANESRYSPNRVTVFAGGATLDVANGDWALKPGAELRAPYGKGVTAVALGDAATMTFVAPPAVRIDGDGAGASAIALLDKRTRKLIGIKVTGRGNGYTTATATIYSGSVTTPVATLGEVTLEENVSGGLVKKGVYTMTVSATNTYTGATTLKEGMVKLGADDVFASASELVLDGGTLDLDGHRQAFADLTFKSGSVVNGGVTLTSLAVDFDAALAGEVKTVNMACVDDYAPGTALDLKGYDLAKIPAGVESIVLVKFENGRPATLPTLPTIEIPTDWKFAYVGNKLKICKEYGLMLLVK